MAEWKGAMKLIKHIKLAISPPDQCSGREKERLVDRHASPQLEGGAQS
jgi:hypothetical protein